MRRRTSLLNLILGIAAFGSSTEVAAQQAVTDASRIVVLEQRLRATEAQLTRLQETLDALVAGLEAADIFSPHAPAENSGNASAESDRPERTATGPTRSRPIDEAVWSSYRDRILVPDLGGDERADGLEAKPELFVQTRYQASPLDEARDDDVTRNFTVNRMELRWAGRVTDDVGLGFEAQYHPAPDGAPEELVNDAFAEYYVNDAITLRAGQFIKPFGFDIQHSSSTRESPERGIFAGYFFPGQRDRGLMISADLQRGGRLLAGTTLYAGVFNGNRFFNDSNDDLNYNFRIRRVFESLPLAIGASAQLGTQLLPPGLTGPDDEDIYGVDLQYVVGRLGVRAEYVRGDMPSTLLSLTPEFAPAFLPDAKSSGAAAFFNYSLTADDEIYWRWDRYKNDPVSGNDIRAFNLGYVRAIGESSRIAIDYQTKSDVTFNDDALNTKLSVTWNLTY